MPLVTLDALTLRSQHYSETSRIVSFYSREQGLVKGIAKGARGKRGRFAASLEPLQRVRVTLAVKETRDLQTVTQADLLHPFPGLREDLFRVTYAQACAELLGRLVWREHPSEEVFDLLLVVLRTMEEDIGDPELLFFAFQAHLARLLGYGVETDRCAVCGGDLEGGGTFHYPQGAVACASCYVEGGAGMPLDGETADLVRRLSRPDGAAAAAGLTPDAGVRRRTERLLRRHLEYHTETDLGLKALKVSESLRRYGAPAGSGAGEGTEHDGDAPTDAVKRGLD
ncbi:MAG: DNA repair protein RecO [bacterium]